MSENQPKMPITPPAVFLPVLTELVASGCASKFGKVFTLPPPSLDYLSILRPLLGRTKKVLPLPIFSNTRFSSSSVTKRLLKAWELPISKVPSGIEIITVGILLISSAALSCSNGSRFPFNKDSNTFRLFIGLFKNDT